MSEVWKAIEGYEGKYQVSSLGRVRSLDRMVPTVHNATRMVKGKTQTAGGYRWRYIE